MSGRWHVEDALLSAWVDGSIGLVSAASVEQHVVACVQCQDRVRRVVGDGPTSPLPELPRCWAAVRDAVELPSPSRLERALSACGLPAADAVLAAAAPALRGAWLGVVAFVVLFVGAAGHAGTRSYGVTLFLMIAPLVPVLAVALAYSAEAEPALEQEAATPYPKVRLVLLRVAAVLAVSLPVVALASVILPASVSALWLLPATGFTAAVLAASTWTDPARVAVPVVLGWVAAVGAAAQQGSSAVLLTGGYLLVYSVLLVGGVVAFALRIRRFGVLGRFS